jgi:hypothetical protein
MGGASKRGESRAWSSGRTKSQLDRAVPVQMRGEEDEGERKLLLVLRME